MLGEHSSSIFADHRFLIKYLLHLLQFQLLGLSGRLQHNFFSSKDWLPCSVSRNTGLTQVYKCTLAASLHTSQAQLRKAGAGRLQKAFLSVPAVAFPRLHTALHVHAGCCLDQASPHRSLAWKHLSPPTAPPPPVSSASFKEILGNSEALPYSPWNLTWKCQD